MATEPSGAAREEAIRSELVHILGSASFRGTRRSQDFLRYVVERALARDVDSLKERSIGIEVFGRPPEYDTGQDSIVRVNANELRKRLAQYYSNPGTGSMVQIELPAGSYAPEFRWRTEAEPPAPAPHRRGRWIVAAVGMGVVGIGAAAAVFWQTSRPQPIERFWQPVIASPQPVLLCVAHPVVYHLSGEPRLREPEGGGQDQWVPSSRVVRDPDHYVGVGDAIALARMSAYFSRVGKASQVRIGTDTSFTDLRQSPAVLIGAYTNQWTMQVTKDCRFVFERDAREVFVRDRADPQRRWVRAETTPPSDYAIISRLIDSKTGSVVVVAAGLAHFGTHVAGELLTNPAALAEALREAPPGWEPRNLQLVVRAEVIGQTPGPAKVLATHVW